MRCSRLQQRSWIYLREHASSTMQNWALSTFWPATGSATCVPLYSWGVVARYHSVSEIADDSKLFISAGEAFKGKQQPTTKAANPSPAKTNESTGTPHGKAMARAIPKRKLVHLLPNGSQSKAAITAKVGPAPSAPHRLNNVLHPSIVWPQDGPKMAPMGFMAPVAPRWARERWALTLVCFAVCWGTWLSGSGGWVAMVLLWLPRCTRLQSHNYLFFCFGHQVHSAAEP